jgi:hypothetical protein
MFAVAAERRSGVDARIALNARLRVRPNALPLLPQLGGRYRTLQRHELNKALRVCATREHAPSGIHQPSQLGSRKISSSKRFSPCLPHFRHQKLLQRSAYRAGMQGASAKGTPRIRGTGERWRNSLEFQKTREAEDIIVACEFRSGHACDGFT